MEIHAGGKLSHKLLTRRNFLKPTVFIHTNHKQMLGALVSRYSLQKNSTHADKFDVEFIEVKDYPCVLQREGQRYLRDGDMRPWLNEDLQSFTPLRFAPPELMNYEGRALVIDPDVFAIGDIWELLSRDMAGSAIVCRPKSGRKGRKGAYASSVMLLDCAQLKHWRFENDFTEMFEPVKRDYMDWVSLKLEDPSTIGLLENKSHGRYVPAISPQALVAPRASRPVWRLQVRRHLCRPSGPTTRGLLFWPGAGCTRRRRAHRSPTPG